jgi:hypothetical protein
MLRAPRQNLRAEILTDDPPLVDALIWGDLLERHLDGSAHCDAEPPLPPAIWLSQHITPSI